MEIADLVSVDGVVANLKASSKKQALQELAGRAAQVTGLHERAIFHTLLERERLGTTGVGVGIAIPHGKLADLDRLYGLFARLVQPIDFEAIDHKQVNLFFIIAAPEDAIGAHLNVMSRLSYLMKSEENRQTLMTVTSPGEVLELIDQVK